MTLSVEEFNQHAAAHAPGAGQGADQDAGRDAAREAGRGAGSAAVLNPAVDLLMLCAPIPSWCDAVIARAPYASAEELVTAASELTESWTAEEVFAALADHPRIGEKATGASAQAAASRREQSGLSADDQAQQQWIDANAEYEQRFGCIFLIRAAGRTSQQMMEQLQQRLRHDPEVENQVRRDQLAQIALLRLADGLNTTPPAF